MSNLFNMDRIDYYQREIALATKNKPITLGNHRHNFKPVTEIWKKSVINGKQAASTNEAKFGIDIAEELAFWVAFLLEYPSFATALLLTLSLEGLINDYKPRIRNTDSAQVIVTMMHIYKKNGCITLEDIEKMNLINEQYP